jgi:hypothetical protein
MAHEGALLKGSGGPSRFAFRCRGGCMENAPDGWQCCPKGTPRYAVKAAVGDSAARSGGARSDSADVADYCSSCWSALLACAEVDVDGDARDGGLSAANAGKYKCAASVSLPSSILDMV